MRVWLRMEMAWRIIKGELSVQMRSLKISDCIFLRRSVCWSTVKLTLLTVRPIKSTYASRLNWSFSFERALWRSLKILPKTKRAKLF